jgi:hypothetical protein
MSDAEQKSVTEELIANADIELFMELYEEVERRISDKGHLQKLVDAINDRIPGLPQAFRPAELSIEEEVSEEKNPRATTIATDHGREFVVNALKELGKPAKAREVFKVFERLVKEDKRYGEEAVIYQGQMNTAITNEMKEKTPRIKKNHEKNADGKVIPTSVTYEYKGAKK